MQQRMLQKFPKGIYLLPSLITTLALFCGFYALIAVFNGFYYKAAVAIIIAAMFDFMDGKVARLTNSTSRFGMEYDSLSDLMSFGIAPGLLVYSWVLQPYGRIGWMAAFLYVICGALRLARYNTVQGDDDYTGNKFIGLPIPAAAIVIASLVILANDLLLMEKLHPMILVITVYTLAFLMVSNVRYASPKQFEFKKRRPFEILVVMVLLVYIVAVIPELMVFLVAVGYVLSGPVLWIAYKRHSKKEEAAKSQKLRP
ncbi:MAG: CDP-diacylglycerol--serine O-phosphatidyltransferase [bacterium]|nr:MAG: CDP-diacylglycerol--serine O-phosphatidyltransferase [bacterium]